METNTFLDSPIDDSRPFRSVKEAVALFGDRILSPPKFSFDKGTPSTITPSQSPDNHLLLDKQHIDTSVIAQSPVKPPNSPPKPSRFASERQVYESGKQSIGSSEINDPKPSPQSSENGNVVHGNDLVMMLMVLKKLEADLQETKMEVKLLKERELETEISLSSLNAELHKNMENIAKAETKVAATATAAVAKSTTESPKGEKLEMGKRDGDKERRGMIIKSLDSPTLAQILSISDYERYFGGSNKNSKTLLTKKKPVIPLVTDFFPWKKKSSPKNDHLRSSFPSHLYSS